MNATSVKLEQIAISENTCILYTIIMIYSIYESINSENNLNKLTKYSNIIDLSIGLNEEYWLKEKKLILYVT